MGEEMQKARRSKEPAGIECSKMPFEPIHIADEEPEEAIMEEEACFPLIYSFADEHPLK